LKLERSNILELIGSGKSKYHSCVITSYSIDLAFFEQLILPRLRGAGITNINILVDAAMLEKYLATHLGNSTSNFKAKYSITPVHISGAFHPKMLFLAGKERSYLAVGSGNITSSGLLYNDEIWSSFYMSKDKKSAQPIFKSAWAYIQNLSTFCSGINQTKIKWIPQHSKWIEALADNQEEKANIKETAYKLYYTKQDISLYKELISELLPKPKSIKIIAPYYNRSGAFLQNLVDDLNPLEMHCIVEKANGILPSDFQSSLCQFSDWSDVIKPVNSSGVQKLHAKIIQIEYKTHTVLIIGSANATLEAFGISNRNFKNEEAIIRIQSPNSRDFLKELGISIPKEGTLDIQKTESTEQNNQETLLGLLKIKHAELSQQTLRITLLEPITKSVLIKIFSSNNELLESIELSASSSIIETALVAVENTFKVAFYDIKTLQRISSFGLIQNADVLKRSNPDERLARIQSFESLDIFNSLDYELVLNFLSEEHIFKESNSSQTTALENTTPSSDMGQVISEKEYNRNAGQSLDEKITNENITSLVEDFLDVLKIRENDEELSSNIEELALAASDDGLDNDSTLNNSQKIIAAKEGKRIARKIIKTIKAVNNLINNRTSTDIPQNIRTLNALFIGFHILLHFWDEVYTEELSVVKIRYKNLTALSRLEKKFGLIRLNTQAGCSKQEVLYQISYIDINSLQHFVINSW
jgi:HKD family nuclease